MTRPDLSQVPLFYHGYINLVPDGDLKNLLEETQKKLTEFLTAIPDEKWHFRYADGKWSIKEMVQHLIDADRIFSYRALCIARGETASLPGFDENEYAATSAADARTKESLLQEFDAVQKTTTLLFQSFAESQLARIGTANSKSIQVRTIGFISVGHRLHHKLILESRYLN